MQTNQHSETWPGLPGTPEARNSFANAKTTILASLVWALALCNGFAQPAIDTQPADQTAIAGLNATFCVTASGAPPLSYQWRDYTSLFVFTDIPGATNPCLVLTNVLPTTHRFGVVVSNSSGW
jgi:hypothetical protein